MAVIWTRHAQERQREWQRSRGITREEAERLVCAPEQVVPGDLGASVAQSRRRDGLLRAPFVEVEGDRRILTVYWTSRVGRYWQEEHNADSI